MTPLVVIGPLPPPLHGVTISTSLVLANDSLRDRFAVRHLDTSDHRPATNTGRWDVQNVVIGLLAVWRLVRCLRGPRGVVYLPLSQNTAALLRDTLFIHVAALRGWKVAAHLRGSDFRDFYESRPRPFRAWVGAALRRLDSIAVMGGSLRWLFEGLVPSDRIAVVPNGTPDPHAGGSGPNGSGARGSCLFLSNLRRRKGVVEALDAALLVLREAPDARFTFVGAWEDPDLEHALRERAAAAGDRIEFLPVVDGKAKRELIEHARMLLFPPVEPEGHPRVVLEAIAAGTPVVTTDRGAIAETVIDGESGFVLDEPVPEELADRVLRLIRDEGLRERMSSAARRRYLEHFTQEVADRRIAEWLGAVAERP